MMFSLLKDKRGGIFSPELDALAENEGYQIEGVDVTLTDEGKLPRTAHVNYPMPEHLVTQDTDETFYLGEIWVDINDKGVIENVVVIYDRTSRVPKIFRRIDH